MPENLESRYFEVLRETVKLHEQKNWVALAKQLDRLDSLVTQIIEREKKRKRGDK